MALAKVLEPRFSYREYLQWPEGERWELVDGVAHAMGPAPARRHQVIVGELFRQIANALKGRECQVFFAPFDVRLPKADEADEEIDTVVQPDIVVVCDRNKLDERGCRGAPDWIIEVVSPTSESRDQILKRDLYQRVGVKEYWIVQPEARQVIVYRLEAGTYRHGEAHEFAGTLAFSAVPRVAIDWGEFADIV